MKRIPLTLILSGILVGSVAVSNADDAKVEKKTETHSESKKIVTHTETKAAKKEAAPAPGQLVKKDLKVGTGKTAKAGDTVTVNYTGWLTDGKQFDSSIGRSPFVFPLGAGRVIKGWDMGVEGMKEGGKRKLTIPSDLAYGPSGTPGGPIPPNATLVFDVELLKVDSSTQ